MMTRVFFSEELHGHLKGIYLIHFEVDYIILGRVQKKDMMKKPNLIPFLKVLNFL